MKKYRVGSIIKGCVAAFLLLACGSGDGSSQSSEKATGSVGDKSGLESKNHAPEIRQIEITPSQLRAGVMATVRVDAVDVDGDSLSYGYEWKIDGQRVGGGDQTLALSDVHKGQKLEVTVVVRDRRLETRKSLTETIGNSPPVVESIDLSRSGPEAVLATPRAKDRDHDAIEFRYRWSINDQYAEGDGPVFDVSDLKMGDKLQVEVTPADEEDEGIPSMSKIFSLENAAPIFTSSPKSISIEGNTLTYQVRAEDPDRSQRLRYRLEEGPDGMVLDPLLGELSWTPSATQTGEFPVRIVVEDLNGGAAVQTFTVTSGDEEAANSDLN